MKNHSLVVAVMTFLCMASAADAKYSGGTGEPNDPYRIATPENLNDVGNYQEDWDKHFILVNDVNLAQYTGTQFNIIGAYGNPFTGIFDGNDHKIWNFTLNGIDYIGMFGCVDHGGKIKNLGMENVNVNAGGNCVGGLVGYNKGGTITNCYSTGNVWGSGIVGGLVGLNDGTITNCYSTGNVSGSGYVGGLVGASRGEITNCYSTGSVGGDRADCRNGGLVGLNDGTITNCYSTGSVGGDRADCRNGGLVGGNEGTINNCYSTGNVRGDEQIGGFVGRNGGTITNCYSTGNVTANYEFDGFGNGSVTASFWDTETSGQSTSSGGTGKNSAEMKGMGTFTDAGWDFVEIWGIGENQTYPFLRTEPAGDLSRDKKVDFVDLAILAVHWLAQSNP